MKIGLYELVNAKARLTAVFWLGKDGKIQTKVRPGAGSRRMVREILSQTELRGKDFNMHKVDPKTQPKKWLSMLPYEIHGTYCWAQEMKGKAKTP